MAAFWSIAWPSWFASMVLLTLLLEKFGSVQPIFGLLLDLVFFCGQALLVPRLVFKKYRSFRIAVLREDDRLSPALTLRETAHVSFQVIWPQLVFWLAVPLFALWTTDTSLAKGIQGISKYSYLARLFLIGPWAVIFALKRNYKGFGLQAYGRRYI